ncbi:MAG: 4-(cytidine 5'-diphospho)-2-C-methyl-D-erythritol kinase [Planctomycetota bacterium]|jgi:4-diphosphocytidyl-2-C-methyl-D-erythritol kinase
MALLLPAPAKLNLGLRVLGKRADGYHDLESVFHSIELKDLLYAESCDDGLQLDLHGETELGMQVAADEDNLVLRAGRIFCEAHQAAGGMRFVLQKHIPAGAGLGGGSSDAAAALLLANELHGRPLDLEKLSELALHIGSDVPFFLSAGTQLAKGRGEILSPLEIGQKLYFLLVFPPVACSTAAVYKNHKPNLNADLPSSSIRSGEGGFPLGSALAGELGNDLEASAMELYPQLASIRQSVATMGFPRVSMSGSGSTLFLIFSAPNKARAAMRTLQPLTEEGVQMLLTESAGGATGTRIHEAVYELPKD